MLIKVQGWTESESSYVLFDKKCGFTLRDVEERSASISQHWGDVSYRISASWLDRVERENRAPSGTKLIVLGVIYSLSSEELLALYVRDRLNPSLIRRFSSPNKTLLLTLGPLEEYARGRLPDLILAQPTPDETTLLPPEDYLPVQLRRGVIGKNEKGRRIYSAAYIMLSGGPNGESKKHRSHLRLLEKMINDEVPKKLSDLRTMQEGFTLRDPRANLPRAEYTTSGWRQGCKVVFLSSCAAEDPVLRWLYAIRWAPEIM